MLQVYFQLNDLLQGQQSRRYGLPHVSETENRARSHHFDGLQMSPRGNHVACFQVGPRGNHVAIVEVCPRGNHVVGLQTGPHGNHVAGMQIGPRGKHVPRLQTRTMGPRGLLTPRPHVDSVSLGQKYLFYHRLLLILWQQVLRYNPDPSVRLSTTTSPKGRPVLCTGRDIEPIDPSASRRATATNTVPPEAR